MSDVRIGRTAFPFGWFRSERPATALSLIALLMGAGSVSAFGAPARSRPMPGLKMAIPNFGLPTPAQYATLIPHQTRHAAPRAPSAFRAQAAASSSAQTGFECPIVGNASANDKD